MPRKKVTRTTKRQKKLVEGISKGLTISDAGRLAGYADAPSAHRAYKTIRLRWYPCLEAAGYNVNSVLQKIFEKIYEKMECKETVLGWHQGICMQKVEVIPHAEQRAAANDLARFIGAIGNGHDHGEPVPVGMRPGHITIQVALPPGVDPKVLMAISAERPANNEQPVLDVRQDEDEGRPGPEPTL